MRRRRRRLLIASTLFVLALPAVASAQPASAQPAPAELRWTRIPTAELERYQAAIGGVRLNNFTIGAEAGRESAGPATAQEFGVSVANRGADGRRVILQLVGQRADGTPTFSTETEVSVEPRRNESARASFFAAEEDMQQTAAYHLGVLTLSQD
jgi:hypothetical protein